MTKGFDRVSGLVDSYSQDMVRTMKEMIPIRAVSPMSGGEGEMERARYLEGVLKSWGLSTHRYDYTDGTGTARPNIISTVGDGQGVIWLVGHMDTVAEGDRSLWKTDPFALRLEGDLMYGRGTSDDGQGVVSCMYALRALVESGITARYKVGLALVADEELGSRFGMQKLMEERKLFGKRDMFVVPDSGNSDGSVIEIGEKGLLWLKITVNGRQVHASTPGLGVNAFRESIEFLHEVDVMLHSKYNKKNALFRPSMSTFEMTKHEKNVDSTNIVPGTDISYMDCRVLPDYRLDDVVKDVREVAGRKTRARIDVEEYVRDDPAPVTDANAEVVKLLESSITELRGIKPKKIGIGGGTCAAFPRKKGMQAAVWMTEQDVAHQPNEYARVGDMVADAKVFAHMAL